MYKAHENELGWLLKHVNLTLLAAKQPEDITDEYQPSTTLN